MQAAFAPQIVAKLSFSKHNRRYQKIRSMLMPVLAFVLSAYFMRPPFQKQPAPR
ncbi:hypothetical protein HMPREF9098_0256 [Kingella denitrificans ATCC 33394]|uniref:Uncharacterized protein n=1 Tax=Kingella denitrificans ATCC 33394 TaxID=888741 RepID=F0EWM6_9NEIS|nr:hypothetical protein HMPREF9098_0256 [Kingella denitrificans ATCC 33394]